VIEIAFATFGHLPEIHHDDGLVAEVLRGRGISVKPAVWSDPLVDWRRFASVVIRSTWDYHLEPERYAAWLRQCAAASVNLWNPPATVLENMNKRYLADLAGAGVDVVAMEYLECARSQSLRGILERHGWSRGVVKPAISASAFGTWRTSVDRADVDQIRLDREVAERSLLVQPFVDEIVAQGEWSLVFFGGEYSHAVLKRPAEGDFRVQEELGGDAVPCDPPSAVIEQARNILARVGSDLLYARVDGVERNGRFVLMEVEINEPFLYLGSSPGAALRFADAIVRGTQSPLG
jgi:glutathione synthase/RimK-type ligase-like ATP-grasp enzyme